MPRCGVCKVCGMYILGSLGSPQHAVKCDVWCAGFSNHSLVRFSYFLISFPGICVNGFTRFLLVIQGLWILGGQTTVGTQMSHWPCIPGQQVLTYHRLKGLCVGDEYRSHVQICRMTWTLPYFSSTAQGNGDIPFWLRGIGGLSDADQSLLSFLFFIKSISLCFIFMKISPSVVALLLSSWFSEVLNKKVRSDIKGKIDFPVKDHVHKTAFHTVLCQSYFVFSRAGIRPSSNALQPSYKLNTIITRNFLIAMFIEPMPWSHIFTVNSVYEVEISIILHLRRILLENAILLAWFSSELTLCTVCIGIIGVIIHDLEQRVKCQVRQMLTLF